MINAVRTTGSATSAPLAGVTVVSLEQAVSAPMCTRILADFGARVVKIENPQGGDFTRDLDDVVNGLAAHFVWVNRGKESVTLNLKLAQGIDILHRLLRTADVMVSNLAPGATARLGVAPEQIAKLFPHIIAIEIDGYGRGGPLSHKRAYDLLVQAESGTCSVTGHAGAPAKPGPPVADVTTGLYAAITAIVLLYRRNLWAENRPGATASVSMFDTMVEMLGYHLNFTGHTGVDQEPLGMSAPAVAPYSSYPTADGYRVVMGTTNDREWQRLARNVIQRPDLADDTRLATNTGRVDHREELDNAIAHWCSERDLAEIQATADSAGIGNARYNRISDVIEHPHLSARQRWRMVDTPHGSVPAVLPPPIIDGWVAPMGALPALGEHTDHVLARLGLSTADIAELRAIGAVGASADGGTQP